jgi:hypothetical protein
VSRPGTTGMGVWMQPSPSTTSSKEATMSRARDLSFHRGPFGGGVTFYPYQLALGFSLRYWPCIFAPAFRLHVGPVKLWGYVSFKGGDDE